MGEGRLPAWYTKYVKARLQLGLDLQGGIHLVYEVEMDKAVSDKADRLAADIEQKLRKDKKVEVKLVREGRDDILVQFARPADLKVMDKKFMIEFRNQLSEADRDDAKGTLRLKMDEAYIKEVEDYALRQGIETIRGRVDKFGVAEPNVYKQGREQIVIQLPGIKNPQEAISFIKTAGRLEFKLVDSSSDMAKALEGKVPEGREVLYSEGVAESGAGPQPASETM